MPYKSHQVKPEAGPFITVVFFVILIPYTFTYMSSPSVDLQTKNQSFVICLIYWFLALLKVPL